MFIIYLQATPAILDGARLVELPLGALAVHGLEVVEGGADVVLVQLPLLQLALVPLHVRAPVPHYSVNLLRK